ncbi:MAG: SGNH/GDSL hydrolase family protein [Acidimicrobiales bacterium]
MLAAAALLASACGATGSAGQNGTLTQPRRGSSPPTASRPTSHPGSTAPARRSGTSTSTSTSTSSTTTTTAALSGDATVLEIGDSLGEDLGFGMAWALSTDASVHLIQDAKGDTGLVNEAYYDWPEHLSAELAQYHPEILVVFLGGNDVQNFFDGSTLETVGSPGWDAGYGARVGKMMDEATAAGSRVIWVGMPVMSDPAFSAHMAAFDAIYQREAAAHEGVTYFSSWPIFSGATGQYVATRVVNGQSVTLRDPDGIHLDFGGADLLGAAVVKEMDHLYGLEAVPPTSIP